jgi:hypothetical protein
MISAQRLQFMLMQSGYRAMVLAHRKQDGSISHAPRVSISNTARTAALPGDVELDVQTSSHLDTASSTPVSNLRDKTSEEAGQSTNSRIDTERNNFISWLSQDSSAIDPHTTTDDASKDQRCKLKDQWLLLCFYHNKHVSRAVHMKVSEEPCDIDLIRSFQKEYVTTRGMLLYYLSWKRVTNIKFVRVSIERTANENELQAHTTIVSAYKGP